jgi:membrane protein
VRALTFWLRPGFVLRVINRFQKIAGFDRAIALASSALTALIPLVILTGTLIEAGSDAEAGDWIIERYELSGAGARAVRDVFSPVSGSSEGASAVGGLLMLLAVLSFTRAFQRVFEQSWELAPLSVRNTLNGLRWIAALAAYTLASAVIHALLAQDGADVVANVAIAPLTAVFLIWSGWTLSARRVGRSELWAFGVLAAVLLAVYSVFAARFVPPQVSSYAEHYGVLGVVLAAISTLFCVMLVIVGCAVLGREVRDELHGIRRGRRPPDDEVRREWANVVAEARSRWQIARGFVGRLRDHGDRSGQSG